MAVSVTSANARPRRVRINLVLLFMAISSIRARILVAQHDPERLVVGGVGVGVHFDGSNARADILRHREIDAAVSAHRPLDTVVEAGSRWMLFPALQHSPCIKNRIGE